MKDVSWLLACPDAISSGEPCALTISTEPTCSTQHSALNNGTLYSNNGTDIILAVCFVDSFRHALTISRRLVTRLIIHSTGSGENLSKSSTFRNLPYSAGIVLNKSTLMPSPELRYQSSTPLRSQLLCPSLEAEKVPISSLKQCVVADGDDIALYGRS